MTITGAVLKLREFQRQIIHGSNVFGEIADIIETLAAERNALRAQIHDLCHDKHTQGPVTPEEFCLGCEQFQQSLFGTSPITALRAALEEMSRKRACIIFAETPEHVADFFKPCDAVLRGVQNG